ncbi:MAG: DUF3352 domain-containing protein [Chloroflexi bacterium]|nr:DUF3352 domain-containing protein [Chloroflexota bacterium]
MTSEVPAVPTTRLPGSSRGRWLIALAVAGAAVALLIAAVVLLGGRQTPEALRYIPADAVVVAELRLDLPGDQLQKVGNLLAHFPGFADQSTLGQKLDEAGDRLLANLSQGEVSYTGDLKPWVSGPAFGGIRLTDGAVGEGGLFVATTNGAAGCDQLFEGRSTRVESHRGLEIRVLEGEDGACVIDGRHVIAGDLGSVKAGLDAHAAGNGIDAEEPYRAARAALGGDQLGTVYVSGEAIRRLQADLDAVPVTLFAMELPDWSIAGVRAEDDALILDSLAAPVEAPSAAPSLQSLAPAHPSEMTRFVPADAIAYAEVQGAGTSVMNALALLRADPVLGASLAELDQLLTGFGGAEKLLGWVEDVGVVIMNDGGDMVGEPAGVALLLAPDEATAQERVANYRSLLALAALGGAVELETTTVDGVEVTTVTVAGAAGLPGEAPIQVRFAVNGRVVMLGTTEAVMNAVLAVDPASSLAASDDFTRTTARGLPNPRTMVYFSAEHALALEQHFLPLDQRADFRTNVRPYLEPIEAFHMSATDGPGGPRARIVMTVTEPAQP